MKDRTKALSIAREQSENRAMVLDVLEKRIAASQTALSKANADLESQVAELAKIAGEEAFTDAPVHSVASAERESVLIGGHFRPNVRKVLKAISAESGMSVKDLLGHAINRMALQHGLPQPYAVERYTAGQHDEPKLNWNDHA